MGKGTDNKGRDSLHTVQRIILILAILHEGKDECMYIQMDLRRRKVKLVLPI